MPPGLPPGFPNMMDIHTSQALLNLARSGNFLQPPVSSANSNNNLANLASTNLANTNLANTNLANTNLASANLTNNSEAKKRPLNTSAEALDLSPPTNVVATKKPKFEIKPSAVAAVDPTILNWSVSEVSNFVGSIDICKEYAEVSPFDMKLFSVNSY